MPIGASAVANMRLARDTNGARDTSANARSTRSSVMPRRTSWLSIQRGQRAAVIIAYLHPSPA